ncbi:general stress protein [Agrococcus sp. SCSIO52902]|uniref:general stress protein n=1 Tax=Agrococcus sp. SCSIO52902 TaxID=2933290 RepID=UPI0032B10996
MFQGAARGDQQLPRGVVVASFETYEQAQAAIAKVSGADADLAGLAIVGNDLKIVERITGRLTWGKVAGAGALRGLGFGAFIGLVYMLFVPEAISSVLLFPLLGLAFGILLGVLSHAMTRRKRDYASVQQVLAGRYDVMAPQQTAGKAMHIIGQRGTPVPIEEPEAAPTAQQPAAPPMPEQLPPPSASTPPEQPSDERR